MSRDRAGLMRIAAGVRRLTAAIAMAGGLLALAVATLVVISVLGRWLFSTPIEGDFEFVKMATAIAVFCYLPYAQMRRENIMVDTFTTRLPPRARHLLDAFWDLAYAGFAGLIAYGLAYGAILAARSGESTMQLQIVIWPAIAISAVLAVLLALAALLSAVEMMGEQAGERL